MAEHIKRFVLSKVFIPEEKVYVIPNGIDLSKQEFKERKKGFNIAYVGYINFKLSYFFKYHIFSLYKNILKLSNNPNKTKLRSIQYILKTCYYKLINLILC